MSKRDRATYKMAEKVPPKICCSVKSMGRLAKIVKIKQNKNLNARAKPIKF